MIKKTTIFVFVTVLLSACGNSGTSNKVEDEKDERPEIFSPLNLF